MSKSIKKEIIAILFLFLIVFFGGVLATYSPSDPSMNTFGSGEIHNLFGVAGAYVAGFLIYLFGMGAFCLPFLLVLGARLLFTKAPPSRWAAMGAGGLFFMIVSGALLCLFQNDLVPYTKPVTSGGILGLGLSGLLADYLSLAGAALVLATFWLICLIAATGVSLAHAAKSLRGLFSAFRRRISQGLSAWRARWRSRPAAHKEKPKKIKPVPVGPPPAPPAKPAKPPKKDKPEKPPRIKKAPAKQAPFPVAEQRELEFEKANGGGYALPSINLLDDPGKRPPSADMKNLEAQARVLEKKLEDFGVTGKVVEINPGPVITTFEYEPGAGVKINRITNLSDDLALALRATSVRIVGYIPGKAAVGIEIPNTEREVVRFKDVVASGAFHQSKSKLTICLGKDIEGNPQVTNLAKMPHLLIAGATGSGKSVALNAMIISLLYKATPDEVRFVMVDPKRIELSNYDGIPHLITPVVTDVKKATNALFWAVREMERRYEAMAALGVRNVQSFNQKLEEIKAKGKAAAPDPEPEPDGEDSAGQDSSSAPLPPPPAKEPALEPMPFIVIIIDELADLMMVASRDVETALQRLAQMARAAGIHMILATQRPSVDVLTGTIKANFPTRISFQVSSRTDSRTILDSNGAESLLGAGDMLFLPPGAGKLQRLHGAYLSDDEVSRVLDHIRSQKKPDYDPSVTEARPEEKSGADGGDEEYDEKYDEAVALVTQTRQASISMVQRHLRIGYNRAARIIEMMEKDGVVGPSDGVKPREVLARGYSDD